MTAVLRSEQVPRGIRWAVLAFTVLLAASRAPYILIHGRFWAEEGTLHFARMYGDGFPNDILYVQTRTGYYNFFANIGSWLASNVPLLYAPLVTTWLSFGVVVLVVWVAIAWPSDLLPIAGAKLAAATLLVVGTLAHAEVWLNTINAQTYLGLLALLLLFVRVDEMARSRYAIGIGLLIVAGLSGLYAVALAPLFIVCALLDRNRRRWGFAAAITVVAVVQGVVFVSSRLSGEVAESKLAIPGLDDVLQSVAGLQLGGLVLGQRVMGRLVNGASDGSVGSIAAIAILGLLVLALLTLLLWRPTKRRVPVLLLGALIITEVLVQIGALGETVGRYTVVPMGILLLMLIHGAAMASRPALSWAGVAALAAVLLVGLSQFWSLQPRYLRCVGCPDWAEEVQAHEDGDPSLVIWPYDRPEPWVIRLERSD